MRGKLWIYDMEEVGRALPNRRTSENTARWVLIIIESTRHVEVRTAQTVKLRLRNRLTIAD
jgi:hypothetical protein